MHFKIARNFSVYYPLPVIYYLLSIIYYLFGRG